MNHEFIKRAVIDGLPTKNIQEDVLDAAIVGAVFLLSNLVHYKSERSHYDEDIARVARVLIMAVEQ